MTDKIETHLSRKIDKTEAMARYDACAKELLGDRQVLARIAKDRIAEFRDYDIPTVMRCIEGSPEVSKDPDEPYTGAVTGMNTERSHLSGFQRKIRKNAGTNS